MKIPKSIRISGIDYAVKQVDDLNNGTNMLNGRIDYLESEIYLNRKYGHQNKCVTLLHEIIHGILHHSNIDLGETEEKIIDILAYGIYQVLQDNGRKFFDIVESDAIEGG